MYGLMAGVPAGLRSLRHSEKHEWYYYPRMAAEECLVFKVYDKAEGVPRFVFHTVRPAQTGSQLRPLTRRGEAERRIAMAQDGNGASCSDHKAPAPSCDRSQPAVTHAPRHPVASLF
jgi:hypothetical protein